MHMIRLETDIKMIFIDKDDEVSNDCTGKDIAAVAANINKLLKE